MKELSFRIIIDAQLDGKLAERALSYKSEFFIALLTISCTFILTDLWKNVLKNLLSLHWKIFHSFKSGTFHLSPNENILTIARKKSIPHLYTFLYTYSTKIGYCFSIKNSLWKNYNNFQGFFEGWELFNKMCVCNGTRIIVFWRVQ